MIGGSDATGNFTLNEIVIFDTVASNAVQSMRNLIRMLKRERRTEFALDRSAAYDDWELTRARYDALQRGISPKRALTLGRRRVPCQKTHARGTRRFFCHALRRS